MRLGIAELKNALCGRAEAVAGRSSDAAMMRAGQRIGRVDHRVSGLSNGWYDPLAEAVERALQALVEFHLGLPAELFTRARGVERDVLHLAGPLGRVLDLESVGGVLLQHLDDVEHR